MKQETVWREQADFFVKKKNKMDIEVEKSHNKKMQKNQAGWVRKFH